VKIKLKIKKEKAPSNKKEVLDNTEELDSETE